MINMSYCRFQNTLLALEEAEEWLGEDYPEALSPEERRARDRLVKLCQRIADDWEPEDA